VVVHELCHRRQMNHSQAFWNEVSAVLPGYKEQKKWLKDNGWKLMELGMQESK
jgi:predicted metal-dependent hydrolase